MQKEQVLRVLHEHDAQLRQQGVKALYLIGSVARGEASALSDVDFLVEFDRPVGLFEFCHLQIFLSDLLGCQADLGTMDSLRIELRKEVLKEAIRAA